MEPILFIAPFANMARTAANVAAEMGLEFPIVVGNNQQALKLADQYPDIGIIITRGGTAEDIKQLSGKLVVEITASITDLMAIVQRLAAKGLQKIGVVARSNIIDETIQDFKIGDSLVYMRPCRNDAEIEQSVGQLRQLGVEVVVGCKMATVLAANNGLAAEFFESGPVSIRKAMNEAVRILRAQEFERLRSVQLKAVIDNISEGIVVVTGDNHVGFYNRLAQKVFSGDEHGAIAYQDVSELLEYRQEEKIVEIKGTKLLLHVIPLYANNASKGGVITFREVSNIEDSERKIRFSSYEKGLYAKKHFSDIVFQSEAMRHTINKARKFAQANSNILLYGETGTGKEVFAQSIHNHSLKRQGPFVSVNCASIPPSLMESELFGYVEGAFTGSRKGGKRGLFELAHGGTIFLDEIGELPVDIQSRLLRVLQEKEIMRIGDDRIIPVDARVICATNRDLAKLVREGQFRQDLYYRINILKLYLPPLRERKEDIPLLLNRYLRQYNNERGRAIKVSAKAMQQLMEYSWPGNIRELKNVAEVLTFYDEAAIGETQVGEVLQDRFEHPGAQPPITVDEQLSLKAMEADILRQLLMRYSMEEVCRRLGISRTSLWRKTKMFQK